MIEQLPPHGLVAVHVAHVAHHGLQQLPGAWNRRCPCPLAITILKYSSWSFLTGVDASGDPDPSDVLTQDRGPHLHHRGQGGELRGQGGQVDRDLRVRGVPEGNQH